MKAEELRIGNYLKENTGYFGYFQVQKVVEDEYIYSESDMGQCQIGVGLKGAKPIPLTEEWLIKFGFEREGHFTMRLGKFTCSCEEDYISDFCLGDIELFDVIPKYVHQLQNLFYALCGRELTVKDAVITK